MCHSMASYHTRNFYNGVPQGFVLSPTLFNIYIDDTPPTPRNINIMSYADDFTITSTHNEIPTATAKLQSYLNTLQTWFNTNRLKVAPTKSTITLLTNYTREHRHTPQLTLDNTAIPHKHSYPTVCAKMHTPTQHAPHTNLDRLWATKRNPNTDIQTIHPLGLGICHSSLCSKPCNHSPQHPTNYTEQCSMNHHWLHTNHSNKPPTLQNIGNHITRSY